MVKDRLKIEPSSPWQLSKQRSKSLVINHRSKSTRLLLHRMPPMQSLKLITCLGILRLSKKWKMYRDLQLDMRHKARLKSCINLWFCPQMTLFKSTQKTSYANKFKTPLINKAPNFRQQTQMSHSINSLQYLLCDQRQVGKTGLVERSI